MNGISRTKVFGSYVPTRFLSKKYSQGDNLRRKEPIWGRRDKTEWIYQGILYTCLSVSDEAIILYSWHSLRKSSLKSLLEIELCFPFAMPCLSLNPLQESQERATHQGFPKSRLSSAWTLTTQGPVLSVLQLWVVSISTTLTECVRLPQTNSQILHGALPFHWLLCKQIPLSVPKDGKILPQLSPTQTPKSWA